MKRKQNQDDHTLHLAYLSFLVNVLENMFTRSRQDVHPTIRQHIDSNSDIKLLQRIIVGFKW